LAVVNCFVSKSIYDLLAQPPVFTHPRFFVTHSNNLDRAREIAKIYNPISTFGKKKFLAEISDGIHYASSSLSESETDEGYYLRGKLRRNLFLFKSRLNLEESNRNEIYHLIKGDLNKAIELNPNELEYFLELAEVKWFEIARGLDRNKLSVEEKKTIHEIIDLYSKALNIKPLSFDTLVERAYLYIYTKDYKKAISDLKLILDTYDYTERFNNFEKVLDSTFKLLNRNWGEKQSVYFNGGIMLQLGYCYQQIDEIIKSVDTFEKIVKFKHYDKPTREIAIAHLVFIGEKYNKEDLVNKYEALIGNAVLSNRHLKELRNNSSYYFFRPVSYPK